MPLVNGQIYHLFCRKQCFYSNFHAWIVILDDESHILLGWNPSCWCLNFIISMQKFALQDPDGFGASREAPEPFEVVVSVKVPRKPSVHCEWILLVVRLRRLRISRFVEVEVQVQWLVKCQVSPFLDIDLWWISRYFKWFPDISRYFKFPQFFCFLRHWFTVKLILVVIPWRKNSPPDVACGRPPGCA